MISVQPTSFYKTVDSSLDQQLRACFQIYQIPETCCGYLGFILTLIIDFVKSWFGYSYWQQAKYQLRTHFQAQSGWDILPEEKQTQFVTDILNLYLTQNFTLIPEIKLQDNSKTEEPSQSQKIKLLHDAAVGEPLSIAAASTSTTVRMRDAACSPIIPPKSKLEHLIEQGERLDFANRLLDRDSDESAYIEAEIFRCIEENSQRVIDLRDLIHKKLSRLLKKHTNPQDILPHWHTETEELYFFRMLLFIVLEGLKEIECSPKALKNLITIYWTELSKNQTVSSKDLFLTELYIPAAIRLACITAIKNTLKESNQSMPSLERLISIAREFLVNFDIDDTLCVSDEQLLQDLHLLIKTSPKESPRNWRTFSDYDAGDDLTLSFLTSHCEINPTLHNFCWDLIRRSEKMPRSALATWIDHQIKTFMQIDWPLMLQYLPDLELREDLFKTIYTKILLQDQRDRDRSIINGSDVHMSSESTGSDSDDDLF